ncbi:hypothetical protein NECAME_04113 [Necator americanus]|uniref:G-protein coupled receptors family 1 profile domain-containing protein n=1 Tax=Necator americanus TaxID=51031 RepID=W2SXI4_NECAM|nr:hypothetical protein NECAME_04113 [Necator americanus]ETN74248.1 hypothetical protein NECAME_04113 [Necator americanus]
MNISEEVEECGFFEGYTLQRFVIITSFSLISLFGILANTQEKNSIQTHFQLLMAVFWKTLPASVYLACLASMDMLICLTYLLLFGVDAGFVYLKDKVVFQVKQFPHCNDYFRSESVSPAEWASNSHAYYVFDFHVITAVQTCFPFFVLLILNMVIVRRLVAEKKENTYTGVKHRMSGYALHTNPAQMQSTLSENIVLLEVAGEVMKETVMKRSDRGKRSQLRNAIYTMLAIVMSYLVCNGVHLFLTFLERTGSSLLYDSGDPNQSSNFYIALSDTVSICYMVSSAIRILIYAKCNPKLRQEISDYFHDRKKLSMENDS